MPNFCLTPIPEVLSSTPHPLPTDGGYLSILNCGKAGGLDPRSMVKEPHVAQHHHGAQQQGRGVGHVLACNVRGCPVNLEPGKVHELEARAGGSQPRGPGASSMPSHGKQGQGIMQTTQSDFNSELGLWGGEGPYRLKDGNPIGSDVAAWRHAKTADQACTQVAGDRKAMLRTFCKRRPFPQAPDPSLQGTRAPGTNS